jgi:hypothetical protein
VTAKSGESPSNCSGTSLTSEPRSCQQRCSSDYYLRNATYAGGRQANRPNYRHHSGHKPPTSFTLLNLSGLSFLIPLNETVTYLDSKEKAKVFNERLSAQQSSLAKDFTACVIAELRGSGFQVEILDQVVRPAEKPDKVDIDIVTTTSDAVSHVRFTEVGLFSPRSSTDYLPRVNAQATLFVKGLEDDLYNEDLVYGVDARSGKAWAIAGDPEFAYAGFDKVLANIDNVRLALAPPWRMPRQPPQVTRRLLHRTARLRCPSPWVAPSP